MTDVIQPLIIFVIFRVSWLNRQKLTNIDYLIEENGVLKEQLGNRRLRLTVHQSRHLAMKPKCATTLVMAEILTVTAGQFH